MVPQPLLLPLPCPACRRPGRELSPCPWCGERVPIAPGTRGDLARLAAGLALLAAGTLGTPGTLGAALAGLLSGFFLVCVSPPSGRGVARSAGGSNPCGADPAPARETGGAIRASAVALFAALLALALRAFGAPYPLLPAVRLAWLFPALAAVAFALRVPAEAPNAPASGASPLGRAWRRHAPDVVAALSLVPFAAAFAAGAMSGIALVGLSLVLGVWLSRLASPTVPLLLSAVFLSLLLPDPAFLAFGLLAGGLYGTARRNSSKRSATRAEE